MPDDISFDVALDAQGYVAGAAQIAQANTRLGGTFSQLATAARGVQHSIDQVTPGRASLAGWSALTAAAADSEQAFSSFRATASLTGASYEKLSAGAKQLARDLPIGGQAARQVVQAFNQMGVAGAGSEGRVLKLAESVAKLSGATGEAPAALAAGMADLARATGNTALNPERFTKLGDAVAGVSANAGASAGSILAFSKNIAPMASAAGIGSTGILGISSAFAKLGEDGVGASTAVNKMMSDLNRSVREGTPEIKTYAQFVGQTADQFQALFKANPTEALTQVTEAIGKAGPEGSRMLEMVGIEGIRGQRALQALSASGGLRPAIASASAAYGSGASGQASQAAFSGFNDAMTELTESSAQLAEAFGAPLLTPLTAFAQALKVPTNAARSLVESGFMQKAIQVGAVGAMAFVAARTLAGPLAAIGLGRQAATSSPVRALFAGLAGGNRGTFAGRFGAPVNELYAREGVYGRGLAAGPAARAFSVGDRIREAREARALERLGPGAYYDQMQRQQEGGAQRQGGSPLRRIGRGVFSYGSMLTETYGNVLRQQYGDPSKPIGERGQTTRSPLGAPVRATRAYEESRQGFRERGGLAGGVGNIRETLHQFNTAMTQSTSATREGTNAVKAHAKAFGAASGLMMTGARDVARAGGSMLSRGASSVVGQMGGGVGIGIAAATGLFQFKQTIDANNEEAKEAFSNLDISKTLNDYKESIGKATGAMTTMGSLSDQMGKDVAASTKTFTDATKVTAEDVAAASGGGKGPTHTFIGNSAEVGQQIAALSPRGLAPDELAAVKIDLLRQGRSESEVNQILASLPGGTQATGGKGTAPTGSKPEMTRSITSAIGNAPNSGGIAGILTGIENFGGIGQLFGRGPNWNGPKDPMYVSSMSEPALKAMDDLTGAIQSRFSDQSKTFSGEYAQQERYRSFEESYQGIKDTGNVDALNELSKRMTSILGGSKDAATYITPEQVEASGGSFVRAFAAQNDTARKNLEDYDRRQKEAGGQFKPEVRTGYFSDLLKGVAPEFSKAFNQQMSGPLQQAFKSSQDSPGDVGKLTQAADAFVAAAKDSGASMSDLAVQAHKAAGSLSEASQEFAIVRATQQKLQTEMSREAVNQTGTQTALRQYGYLRGIANAPASNNAALEGERAQADRDSIALQESFKQRMVARLQMQRQADIQRGRATEDFGVSRSRATEDYGIARERAIRNFGISTARATADFNKQQSRTVEDFNRQQSRNAADFGRSQARADQDYRKQVSRQQADFNKQRLRATEDYNTQVFRSTRDFNTAMERGAADFYKTQMRANRDFNIQIARQVEDAAKDIYDPYARIQTKATWDAKNLLVNLREQNDALAKQKTQLDALRKMGLSSQVIDQLQLGKAENAQQVNNLTQDLGKDPSLVGQLNQTASDRAGLTGAMFFDDSNKELARAREDFQKSLADQAADYQTSVQRSRDDMAKSLADQAADFNKTMTRSEDDFHTTLVRQNEDYKISVDRANTDFQIGVIRSNQDLQTGLKRSNEDFHTSLTRSEQDLNISLTDMENDFNRSMQRQEDDFNKSLRRMQEDLREADIAIAGDFKSIMEQTSRAINGQAVEWGKIITNDMDALMKGLHDQVVPEMNRIAGDLGITLPGAAQTQQGYANKYAAMDAATGMAGGGTVQGSSPHPRADNIPTMLTAGEYVQPVNTVNYYGTEFMDKVRNRSIPKEQVQQFIKGGGDVAGDVGTPLLSKDTINDPVAYGKMLGMAFGGKVFLKMADGGRVPQVQDWIRQQDPKPYIWGGTGPGGFDCSGLTGAVYGLLLGKPGAGNGQRYFITTSNFESAGFKRGHGTYTIGVSTTHTAGNLAGLPFEAASTKSGIHVGPTAKSVDTFPVQYYLPQIGDQFIGGGGASGSGGGGSSPVPQRPSVDWNKAFAGFDKKRGGWYGALRDEFMVKIRDHVNAKLDQKYGAMGGLSGAGGAVAAGSEVEKFILAIVKQETGGEANPYASRWGKYAISPTYVNSLALKYLGRPMSNQEYLSSPANQDLLGRAALTSLFNQYGARGAASSWYSGNPTLYNSTKPQPGGPSIKSYVDHVLSYMGYDSGGLLQPGKTMTENSTGKPEMVLTEQQWDAISKLAEQGSRMVSSEQGRQLTAACGIHLSIDRRTINNDHRTDLSGAEITVVANDPEELGMKLRQKEWLSRSTQTRGVNHGG